MLPRAAAIQDCTKGLSSDQLLGTLYRCKATCKVTPHCCAGIAVMQRDAVATSPYQQLVLCTSLAAAAHA